MHRGEQTVDARLVVAAALAADAICSEVTSALRAEGIGCALIKGRTVAEWLYPGDVRGYSDTDLLVDPARIFDAAAVLERLGFAPSIAHVSEHSHPWGRAADAANVDLHVTLWGSLLPPALVWSEIQPWLEESRVGPTTVLVPRLPLRALLIILHAAQHADLEWSRPREDLRRLIAWAPADFWRQVDEVAYRLRALAAAAEGLRVDPACNQVLDALPLVRATIFSAREGAPLAVGLQRLASVPSWRGRFAIAARSLGRPRDERGVVIPALAGERPPLIAYLRGPLWLLGGIPRTVVAMCRRRARWLLRR